MPIFKVGGKLCYFAHVPKCAGTSVEDYLSERFGQLAFLNRKYNANKAGQFRTSSPQHILASDLAGFFPMGFFDHSFAVVRHPVDRVVSAFHYHRDREHNIKSKVSFKEWVKRLEDFGAKSHQDFDNHFRPQAAFIPKKSRVFKLENGLDKVQAWLDEIAGAPHSTSIPNHFAGAYKPPRIDAATMERLEAIYANDFEKLGYTRRSAKAIAA
ncbi:sulfotransferase family 2 domain-containing protein [Falsirhodobacter sp. 20TX0035]|uniref:sulfotransferase family 2 domain-containing protein n=1 Tax=Falsirhodobacter sp. 20TX0035 TaxID=3022019 RepID=UPI00232BD7B4|nr:sulfotransferase family 2 domain-containing protein [Falsirhodobacter sp. 20TX0035]MDB6455115.1 sulfotransferase family 2 domain-containing protein [Falsirhodobacter sp. 20TX0035]